jgi:hypothetical protein
MPEKDNNVNVSAAPAPSLPEPEYSRNSIEADLLREHVAIVITQRQANQLRNILDKASTGGLSWQLTEHEADPDYYGYRETARRIAQAIPIRSGDIIEY